MGEFSVINKIRLASPAGGAGIIKGIGDDCAVLRPAKGKDLLVTADMLVDGVHFRVSQGLKEIGRKAMAVSVSDIYACGGKAKYAVVSCGLPRLNFEKNALLLHAGLLREAKRHGVKIVGGDTVRAAKLTLNVTVIGEVSRGRQILRSGAKPGDYILVTGELGNGAAAFHNNETYVPELCGKFAGRLSEKRLANCMIDISDGLSSELLHLTEESGAGALIFEEYIPLSKRALAAARKRGLKPLSLALNGGEDYELLFTVSPGNLRRVEKLAEKPLKLSVIGRVTGRRKGVFIADNRGKLLCLKPGGYDAFV